MSSKIFCGLMLACALGAQAEPKTLYVAIDDANAADEACEGRGSEALPYWSIQAAVNAAESNDVIKVKPGVYTNNYALAPYSSRQKNRVQLDKPLRLESTEGAEKTVIRGKFSDDYDEGKATVGYGNGAVRGILALAGAEGSVIKGFTFGTCSSQNDTFSQDRGGGVYALANVYIVDCAFTNCWARRGGALEGGTAIRCFFTDNRCGSWDIGSVDNAKLWNCVVHETKFPDSGYRTMTGDTCVNCTIISTGYLRPGSCTFQNCLVGPSGAFVDNDNSYTNSLSGGSDLNGVMLSPFTGDYRLPTGSAAALAGDTSKILALFTVPEEFKATDFAGNAIDYNAATCDLGAIQGTHDPICGAFKDTGSYLNVDGWTVPANMNFRPATYPSQMRVTLASGKAYTSLGADYYPMMDGACYLLAPPNPTEVVTSWTTKANVYWVDDENGSDEDGKGTEAEPYKTIQKAWAAHSGSYVVVNVKPGVYDEGGVQGSDGVWNRITPTMNGGGVILIRAVEGPENTFLVGATNDTDECRIALSSEGNAALQGFTLINGRTTGDHGAAVAQGCALIDCVVSNCVGGTSLFVNPSLLDRTRIVGNACGGEMITGGFGMRFCQIHGNTARSLLSTAGNPTALSCTFTANVTPAGQSHVGYQVLFLNNSIVDANGCEFPVYERSDMGENFLWNYVKLGDTLTASPNFIVADPHLAGTATGDERLLADSPAWTRGSFDWRTYATLAGYKYAQGDINGRALVFNADGSMPMGCNQYDTAAFVEITADRGGLAITGASTGLTVVEEGESRTITVSEGTGATRKVLGFVATTAAGATTHYFADEPSWTYTVDSLETSVRVTAVYDNNWYVDAVNGRDTNDGMTAATAKKTLADVVANTVILAGDVIHAAPGTYNEGRMMGPDHTLTYSRVVLPAGVSLIATEGKDVTFIEGANAPDEVVQQAQNGKDGCGQGATRCLYLNAGCRVEGFTIRKGRGYDTWTSALAREYTGAGIYGHVGASPKAVVVGCDITDCKTGTGAGAYNVVCYRCTIKDNGRSGANVISGTTVVNCLIDGSSIGSIASDNCTIYGSTLRPTAGYAAINTASISCYNSIIIGQNVSSAHYYGCVFATNGQWTVWGSSAQSNPVNCENCRFGTVGELKLGTNLAPTVDSAPLIDQGFAQYMSAEDDAKLDVVGAPRVMNKIVDVGAYEWDVRPVMKNILGVRIDSVDEVTPNAVVEDGQVKLDGDGARLVMTPSRIATVPLAIDMAVSEGVVKAYVGGVLVKELSATGTLDLGSVAQGAKVVLLFEGTGSATVLGVLACNWYVDAENGDDANDGMTAATAKKTLADVVTNTVILAGDVIHAAPGSYNEGRMMGPDHTLTYSRVVLPAGVSLIATEGKDVTFIEGANAPEGAADGCGTNATRCVYLNAGCRLEGFTLRKGRGLDYWTGALAREYSGAGIYGHVDASPKAVVVDCYVTDCKTGTGAGAFNVACYGCTFKKNGRNASNIFSGTTVVNCLVDDTAQGNIASDNCTIYNSTLRPTGGYFAILEKSVTCYNSLIMGQANAGAHYYGCTFATNYPYTAWAPSTFSNPVNCENCRFGTINELKLDANLAPTADSTALIDQGYAQYMPAESDDAKLDVVGAPRVMNKVIDVGAYEWDIRPAVKGILGKRVVSVDDVTPNVVTADGKVKLDGNGAQLALTTVAKDITLETPVTFEGTGTLKAYVNGEVAATLTGSGTLKLNPVPANAKVVFAFEGTGSATFAKLRFVRGLLVIVK